MISNYNTQTGTYGGQLVFPTTASFAQSITIPLYIKTIDVPVRKPKITEVNTIPVIDEKGVSDWTVHTMFMGGQGVLTTNITGFFLTPVSTITDNHGQKYKQLDPTQDQAFLGYSYGDMIWAYIQGKMNQPSANIFNRTDPSSYTDPFGNQYNNPIVQQFQCDYSVSIIKQSFQLQLYLEF